MTIKEQALKTIEELPENVGWEVVKERIDFVAGIRRGLDELEAGEGIPVAEIERELREWTAG